MRSVRCVLNFPQKALTGNRTVTTIESEFMTGDTKERISETALELFAQSERNAVN